MPSTLGIVASHRTAAPGPPTTGMVGWWDAADASTFTYSSGVAVSEWRDKSGAGHHFGQSTVADQPPRNGTQNGKPTVTFNGTNQWLTRASWVMTKPVNVFAVARDAATSGQRDLYMPSTDGRIYRTGGGTVATYQGATLDVGAWGTGMRIVAAVFNGAASKLAVDGAAYLVADGGAITFDALGPAALGRHQGAAVEFWQGDMAELLIYERELSTVERQQTETYLRNRWGTP